MFQALPRPSRSTLHCGATAIVTVILMAWYVLYLTIRSPTHSLFNICIVIVSRRKSFRPYKAYKYVHMYVCSVSASVAESI